MFFAIINFLVGIIIGMALSIGVAFLTEYFPVILENIIDAKTALIAFKEEWNNTNDR